MSKEAGMECIVSMNGIYKCKESCNFFYEEERECT